MRKLSIEKAAIRWRLHRNSSIEADGESGRSCGEKIRYFLIMIVGSAFAPVLSNTAEPRNSSEYPRPEIIALAFPTQAKYINLRNLGVYTAAFTSSFSGESADNEAGESSKKAADHLRQFHRYSLLDMAAARWDPEGDQEESPQNDRYLPSICKPDILP